MGEKDEDTPPPNPDPGEPAHTQLSGNERKPASEEDAETARDEAEDVNSPEGGPDDTAQRAGGW